MNMLKKVLILAAMPLAGCQSVRTTQPGVVGIERSQNMLVSSNTVNGSAANADRIGVELAARDGFDPRAAITLWEKMGKLGGGQPPQFLSTHPSHATRIADLRGYSAKVLPLYEAARAKR